MSPDVSWQCARCREHVDGPWIYHRANAAVHGMRYHTVVCERRTWGVFFAWQGWRFLGAWGTERPPANPSPSKARKYAMALHEFIKKARAEKVKGGVDEDYVDPAMKESHPYIHAFLTSTQGDKKGETRLTSTLNLCVDDGVPKAVLNDREEQASLFASGDTFAAAQDALERKLAEGSKEWRAWQGKARKKR